MKQPMIIMNKAGASGAEGTMDVKESKGDPHKLMVGVLRRSTRCRSRPNLPFNWRDLNPVAMIALDEFLLWVNAETPYKTPKEFLAAVKAAPARDLQDGRHRLEARRPHHHRRDRQGRRDKFTYIPYKSGGEAATQLVGKHIDSNVNNPSENIAQWRAGQVRALCVFSAQRMEYKEKITKDQAWADIPTCKESGHRRRYQMLRGFFLPPGTTKEQAAFYADLLKKVVATPEWKEYIEQAGAQETYS